MYNSTNLFKLVSPVEQPCDGVGKGRRLEGRRGEEMVNNG